MKAELLALYALFAILCVSTALMSEDQRVEAFFKRAHSMTAAPDYIKYVVPRLRADYQLLCRTVPGCDRRLMALLDGQQREVQRQLRDLNRLRNVLWRLGDYGPG